jgi:hypothetical protein
LIINPPLIPPVARYGGLTARRCFDNSRFSAIVLLQNRERDMSEIQKAIDSSINGFWRLR